MTHLLDEDLVPLNRADKELPGNIHCATAHRWRTRGVRGVKLEAVLIGGKWYTSREAIRRFVGRTTTAAGGGHSDVPGTNQPAANSAVEQALDEAGI